MDTLAATSFFVQFTGAFGEHRFLRVRIDDADASDAAAVAEVQMEGVAAAYEGILPEELRNAGGLDFRTRQWKGWIERSRTSTFVARVDGDVVAFATLQPSPDDDADETVGDLTAIFVRPSHWRRGLGRQLCTRTMIEAAARGFDQVVAWDLEANAASRAFFEAMGFGADGRTRIFDERAGGALHEARYRARSDPGV